MDQLSPALSPVSSALTPGADGGTSSEGIRFANVNTADAEEPDVESSLLEGFGPEGSEADLVVFNQSPAAGLPATGISRPSSLAPTQMLGLSPRTGVPVAVPVSSGLAPEMMGRLINATDGGVQTNVTESENQVHISMRARVPAPAGYYLP